MRVLWLYPLATLLACSAPAPRPAPGPASAPAPAPASQPAKAAPAPAPQPAAKLLAVETLLKTRSGGQISGPRGWFVTSRPDLLTLEDPGHEIVLAVVERGEPEPARAVAAAWKVLRPAFARPVLQSSALPARGGWDAVNRTVYDVPGKEGRATLAVARRKGAVWYVTLLDAKRAAMERRGGELQACIESLKAPGVEEETFAGKKANLLDAKRLAELETFAEGARRTHGIPGLALSVIQGGKVVYAKGLGVRELGKRGAVTPKTLFMIGSVTKSMTSLMMAALVDRGKLTWDTPVAPLLPGFALGDAAATRKLTLRHTVCACTGLPRQDMELLFEFRGVTPEKRLEELRTMKPTTAFGEAFQYSNPMVSAGGYIAAHLLYPKKSLGAAYDAAMDELLFRPAGMKSTTFDFKRALRAEHASPHGPDWQLRWKPVPIGTEEFVLPIRPAGGAWSNLQDMSRYVMLHLRKGLTPEGKRVVSEENLTRRYQPQVKVSKHASYGLALVVDKSHGIQTIWHTGGTMGFTTEMFFLPEHDFGAVILTNGEGSFLNGVLHRKLLELLFDGRSEAADNLQSRWKLMKDATAKEASKIQFAPDREWLKELVGDYRSPSLGSISLRLEGDGAVLDAGEWKSRVGRKKEVDGTLKLVLTEPPMIQLDFLPGWRDGRRTLLLETPQQKYLFVEPPIASP
jgi:CubicO group peptidase (beta-lactamase class C family)